MWHGVQASILSESTPQSTLYQSVVFLGPAVPLQIEERKQHQARLLDKLSSIQVPEQRITTSPPRLVRKRIWPWRIHYELWSSVCCTIVAGLNWARATLFD
jgi:hypothetical protein